MLCEMKRNVVTGIVRMTGGLNSKGSVSGPEVNLVDFWLQISSVL